MPGGKKTCNSCNGRGGHYADPNGSSGDSARVEREWIPCPVPNCEGGLIDE